ncbi:OLC1v1010606C4 [Oldenlandia corymbosa var. corymbosa]|uniref:OLC1v1010606C4 n=1 Tax=Oldenlandia corymbosa var. corymbosa TaxID=529605 RepID=A0AAV1DUX9_OLDCO|nr:OLC1v1010606C4 [Oldenlandia corymbosa var. corymbosa]
MTSAVFPGRSEHHWSQLDGNLRQLSGNRHFPPRLTPGSAHGTPISRPNFGLTGPVSDLTTGTAVLPSNAPSPRLHPWPSVVFDAPPSASRNQEPVQSKDSFRREHVTFHLFSYSENEREELKTRLISDRNRVRAMLTRIENQEIGSVPGSVRPQVNNNLSSKTKQKSPDPQTAERRPNGRPTPAVTANRKINPKIGGHKQVVASIGGRETKLRPTAAPTKVTALGSMMKKCKHILNTLMTQRHGYVFNKPVDVAALKLYDYYDVIKHPMDLGTIRAKLEKKEYKSAQQFAADVRLTFDNAMTYNPKGSQVHTIAESMLSSFENMFKRDLQQYMAPRRQVSPPDKKKNSSGANRSSPVLVLNSPLSQEEPAPLPRIPQSETGKSLKPRAKDSNRRKMSMEEIVELRENLQRMPGEKMEQVYNIVSKRNHNLVQDGNEVEITVEDLDDETLGELDRLVSNHHKKEMMKTKETEFHLDEILLISEEDPEPKGVNGLLMTPGNKAPQELTMENDKRENSGAEEYVDIGEDAPLNEFPPVEIDRDPDDADTGSSSSSSDDSSSHGSDSGSSSSESDSDC